MASFGSWPGREAPLRSPFGAPGLSPPCIRQTSLPFTATERHDCPDRVRAWQRGPVENCVRAFSLSGMGLNSCFIRTPLQVDVMVMVDGLFMDDGGLLPGRTPFALQERNHRELSGCCGGRS